MKASKSVVLYALLVTLGLPACSDDSEGTSKISDGGMDVGTGNHYDGCCGTCPDLSKSYDDSGVVPILKYQEAANAGNYLNYPMLRLYILCFTKGVDCGKYSLNLRLNLTLYTVGELDRKTFEINDCDKNPCDYSQRILFYGDHDITMDVENELKSTTTEWKVEILGANVVVSEDNWCWAREPAMFFRGSLKNVEFLENAANGRRAVFAYSDTDTQMDAGSLDASTKSSSGKDAGGDAGVLENYIEVIDDKGKLVARFEQSQ
jgi:hypothetical protein